MAITSRAATKPKPMALVDGCFIVVKSGIREDTSILDRLSSRITLNETGCSFPLTNISVGLSQMRERDGWKVSHVFHARNTRLMSPFLVIAVFAVVCIVLDEQTYAFPALCMSSRRSLTHAASMPQPGGPF